MRLDAGATRFQNFIVGGASPGNDRHKILINKFHNHKPSSQLIIYNNNVYSEIS